MDGPALHDDPNRTTPIGGLRYAADYLEAANNVDEKMGKKKGYEIISPIPVYFLVGQSIELALKAFLLSKGVSLRDLRKKYGHDLHRSYRKAKEVGLAELVISTDEELSAIGWLDNLYSSKQLQYIVTGAKTFPLFSPLQTAASKLVRAVGKEVGYPPNI